jgi:hypothetical protein
MCRYTYAAADCGYKKPLHSLSPASRDIWVVLQALRFQGAAMNAMQGVA